MHNILRKMSTSSFDQVYAVMLVTSGDLRAAAVGLLHALWQASAKMNISKLAVGGCFARIFRL